MLSQVEQLVRTNEGLEGPLKTKVILARRALAPQRLKLKEDLERLQKAVFQANRDLDLFDAALAPVRRLSPDILIEIFDLCLPTKSLPQQRMKALLALCHVTSSWRTISLGAPILWSSAFISLECSRISSGFCELEPSPYQVFKESMLEEWFRRSGTTAPLYLVIEFRHTTPQPGTNVHLPGEKFLTALVKPYATRLQHLRVTSCDIITRFFSLNSLSVLNTLQSLVIQRIANSSQRLHVPLLGPDENPTFDLPASPSPLHRLKITSDNLGSNVCKLPIPWNQLTHLSISSLTNRVWFPLLRSCQNLVHGNFGFSEPMGSPSFPADGASPVIHLIHLKSLSLSFHQCGINPRVLNNLCLAQLCALRFASNCIDRPVLWGDTPAFWLNIRKVEELGIYGGVAMNFPHLLPFLINAWNVTRLELQVGALPSKILDLISSPPLTYKFPESPAIILPRLQHLYIMMILPERGRYWINEPIPTFPAPFNINTLRKFFSMRTSFTINEGAMPLIEVILSDDYAHRVPSTGLAVSESLLEIVEELQSDGNAVKIAERDPYSVEEESGDWEYLPHRS